MTYQPKHDIETSDLRGSEQIVVKPGDINIGDLPNSDTATDDMRGHEPPPITDPEADHSKMIIGAVVAAVVIGGAAIYAAGMWNTASRVPAQTPRVATTDVAPPALPAVVPQAAVVEPPVPVQAAPPNEVVQAPVSAPVVKRSVAHNRIPSVRALPSPPPAATSPEVIPPINTPLIAVPQGPTGAIPAAPATEPTQSLPDQPEPPAQSPQPTPTEPPQ